MTVLVLFSEAVPPKRGLTYSKSREDHRDSASVTWERPLLNQSGAVESTAGSASRSPGEPNELQRALKNDGYAIVRNVLTLEEVRFLRVAVKEHLRTIDSFDYGGKFLLEQRNSVPHIEKIIASDSVRRILARATEPFKSELTDICDLAINTISKWHKDVAHCIDINGHAFADQDFQYYKIAFYLQDQDETSPATLKVRPGSHLSRDLTDLPVKKAIVSAGDMIIFDVRIDHLGQLTTLPERMLRKGFGVVGPRLGFDVQKAFTQSRSLVRWFNPRAEDRLAIFMTFGPSGARAEA